MMTERSGILRGMLSARDIIEKKRDGFALSSEEIVFFVRGVTDGSIPEYQVAAWLMAVFLRGMDDAETAALTLAMADSGGRIPTELLPQPALDKHSTGGVGDKASLIVVPILMACGVFVGKMSGRGLGHTGGTLDKLEAIPGLSIDLSVAQILAQTKEIGCCLAGQTADLAPADKKLYALRDVTGTVGSLPLIVASILSKKLAGGAGSFLFDVKVGDGALMKTLPEARALAEALVEGARRNGKRAVAVLSDMSQPLGRTIGNALEVREACEVLDPAHTNLADSRLRELCLILATEGLILAKNLPEKEAHAQAEIALRSGEAGRRFGRLIEMQGGALEQLEQLPRAPVQRAVTALASGQIGSISTRTLGELVVLLGGGRTTKSDVIDPTVGLEILAPVGSSVSSGQTLAVIHAASESQAEKIKEQVRAAFVLSEASAPHSPLVHAVIGKTLSV
jgi:pyrimidine-nucleoside phosphorylase